MSQPRPMNGTEPRRAALRALVAEGEFKSQDELRRALRRRGFRASQPVLSRDLAALGVAKRGGTYQAVPVERTTPLDALRSLLRGSAPAPCFAIVRCEPGSASAVARALEADLVDGLVGTVAGDDTVLVVTSGPAAARRVRARIDALVAPAASADSADPGARLDGRGRE